MEETNRKNKDSADEILVKLRKLKRKTKMTLKEQLKEESENMSIKEYVNESQEILEIRVKCGLDVTEHK